MKPFDQPEGPSLRAGQMWRFEARSALQDQFFHAYFLTREDGVRFFETHYTAQALQRAHEIRYEGVMGDDGLPLLGNMPCYTVDFLGMEGMDRVVEIRPPTEAI